MMEFIFLKSKYFFVNIEIDYNFHNGRRYEQTISNAFPLELCCWAHKLQHFYICLTIWNFIKRRKQNEWWTDWFFIYYFFLDARICFYSVLYSYIIFHEFLNFMVSMFNIICASSPMERSLSFFKNVQKSRNPHWDVSNIG